MFENYNKEKFEQIIGQKESLLLIHTFLEYLYEDVEGLVSETQLNEHIEKVHKSAQSNPCNDRSQMMMLQELVQTKDIQIKSKSDLTETMNFYEKFIFNFLQLTTKNVNEILA